MHTLPIATSSNGANVGDTEQEKQINDLVALLGESMPHDQNSPHYSFLSNFMSLRLMLLKPSPTNEEMEQRGTLLSSFASYLSSGRSKIDIAVMIARDFMFLRQQSQQKPSPRMQAIAPPPANHLAFQSVEQLNLPQRSAFPTNHVNHSGTFMPYQLNQGRDGAGQQQFSVLNNIQIQGLPVNQQYDQMDSSHPNGAMLQAQINIPRMNMEPMVHNGVNTNTINEATDDQKTES